MPHNQNVDNSLTSPGVIFSQFEYLSNIKVLKAACTSNMAVSHSQFLEHLCINDIFESLHPPWKPINQR